MPILRSSAVSRDSIQAPNRTKNALSGAKQAHFDGFFHGLTSWMGLTDRRENLKQVVEDQNQKPVLESQK